MKFYHPGSKEKLPCELMILLKWSFPHRWWMTPLSLKLVFVTLMSSVPDLSCHHLAVAVVWWGRTSAVCCHRDIFLLVFVLFAVCLVVSDSTIPWAEAHQASLSVGFYRQEYWSRFAIPFSEFGPRSNLCLCALFWYGTKQESTFPLGELASSLRAHLACVLVPTALCPHSHSKVT